MNRFIKSGLIGLGLLGMLVSAPAWAEELNLARVEPGSSRIQVAVGLDPAVITTVGYARGLALGSRPVVATVSLGVAAAEPDLEDLRLRSGLQTTLWGAGDWRVAARGTGIARRTSNTIYDGAAFAADLTVHAGFYRHGWFVAGLIGYDRTLVMRIDHSDWYRKTIYEDAVDGWYRGAGGMLHGGLSAGVAFRGVEVSARVERRRLDGGEPLDPPVVGELAIAVPF